MLKPGTQKKFFAFLGAVLVFGAVLGCKSVPPEISGVPEEEEPLCVPAYTQEEIDRELSRLTMLENRRDYPNDAAFANFREIKTSGIRQGQFFRSSHPAMPGTRPPYAARFSEQAKVFTILNLSDTRAEMVRYAQAIPWYQGFLNRDSMTALDTNMDFFGADFAGKLKAGIQYMLIRRGPYLIHCDYGKDRTGFVVVLFEALAGASPEEIIEDYMQSYVNYYGFEKNEERYRIISWVAQSYLCNMNRGRVVTAANTTQAAERYLADKLGLDSGMIAELKERLAGN